MIYLLDIQFLKIFLIYGATSGLAVIACLIFSKSFSLKYPSRMYSKSLIFISSGFKTFTELQSMTVSFGKKLYFF